MPVNHHPTEAEWRAITSLPYRRGEGNTQAAIPTEQINEEEFLARERVCRQCDSFKEEFPVYRCLSKQGCTKLAIKRRREICRKGKWNR